MVRANHQDGTVAGVCHDILHQPADGNAAIFLRQRHTHYNQVKFTPSNLFNDFILRVSNSDLTLGGHAKHFKAFHAACNKPFHTLTLIIVLEIPTERRK